MPDQEGLISPATDAGNHGEHGGSLVLFLHGPEEWFLADEVVRESLPVHCPHCGQHGCMPYGLCNTPATFQRLMQNCLGELNLTYTLIYLDDIIMYSRTEEEHLTRLRAVFERFRESGLKLKVQSSSATFSTQKSGPYFIS